MTSNTSKNEIITVSIMVAIAAATRFLPHPPNFTAIGGMALFGAATLSNKKLALIVPIMAMLVSDLFIPNGFDLAVYTAFIAIAAMGLLLEIKNNTLIWKNGSFYTGDWYYGIFKDGSFYGNWENGIWENGNFGGKWRSGINLTQI